MAKHTDRNRLKQQKLFGPIGGPRYYSFIIIILIGALLVDSLLSDVSSIVNRVLPESTRIVLFSAILGIVILSGSYTILHYTKKVKAELGQKNNVLTLVSRIMPFIQYIVIGLLILITLQIIFTSQYLILCLVALQAISWSTGVILLGIMSYKFIQWYKARRNVLVLLYLVSSLMFCGTMGATIIPQNIITIQSSNLYVNSHSTEVKPFQVNPQTISAMFAIISIANWLILPLAFVVWVATAIMLNHYSKIFGRTKYWLILFIPLICLIAATISYLFYIPSMNSIFDQQVILYTMLAFGGILAEGFLLSFAFILISQSAQVETNSKLKGYLGISAIGVAILFASFFANPSAGSYLPFGTIASSFVGFGAYLFFTGIYSSAISIASDIRLRQTVRSSLLDRSKLLDSIGMADIYIELEKLTVDMSNKYIDTIEEETGIDSSISEFRIKNYVKEAVAELQKTREQKTSNKE